jgi:hypothetical protein
MLSNSLTLAVDTANTGSTTDEVYTRFSEQENRTVYTRADHSLSERHELALTRRFPTRSGNFKGVAKTSIKFTDDTTVTGNDGADIVSPLIGEFSLSVPVGVTDAEILSFRQKMVALLDDDTFIATLHNKQEI